MKNNLFLRRTIFLLIVTGMSLGVLLWGIWSINRIESHYAAAASAVSDIGILARKIVTHTYQLQTSANENSYKNTLGRVRILLNQMEIKHLSLFKGNPRFGSDTPYAAEIKDIYFAEPENAVGRVRAFLDQARFLLEISYPEFTARNNHSMYLRAAVQGGLIRTINQTIHSYREESSAKVYGQITLLISAIIAIFAMAFFRYIYVIRRQQPTCEFRKAQTLRPSVATLFRDFSDRTRPDEVIKLILNRRNNSGQIPAENRQAPGKSPATTLVRMKADAAT